MKMQEKKLRPARSGINQGFKILLTDKYQEFNMTKHEPLIPAVITKDIKILAMKIIAGVAPQLYDECVELLIDTIADEADRMIKVPFSALYRAEIMEKLNIKISHSRYSVVVQKS